MSNEELAIAIKAGEKERYSELWEQTCRFIRMKANRMTDWRPDWCAARGVTNDDLMQSGFIALSDAVQGFNPSAGVAFLTYLAYHLRHRWNESLGLRTEKQARDPINSACSLDEPVKDEDGDPLFAFIQDDNAQRSFEDAVDRIWNDEFWEAMSKVISTLPAPQEQIIRLRYFEGMTLEEAAGIIGKSSSAAQQREQKAIRMLRHPSRYAKIRPFLFEDVEALGLKKTGFCAFGQDFCSSVERAVEKMEKIAQQWITPPV